MKVSILVVCLLLCIVTVTGTCAGKISAGKGSAVEPSVKNYFRTGNSPLPFVDPSGRVFYLKDKNSFNVAPFRMEEDW